MEEFYKSFYFYHISHLHFRMSAKDLKSISKWFQANCHELTCMMWSKQQNEFLKVATEWKEYLSLGTIFDWQYTAFLH